MKHRRWLIGGACLLVACGTFLALGTRRSVGVHGPISVVYLGCRQTGGLPEAVFGVTNNTSSSLVFTAHFSTGSTLQGRTSGGLLANLKPRNGDYVFVLIPATFDPVPIQMETKATWSPAPWVQKACGSLDRIGLHLFYAYASPDTPPGPPIRVRIGPLRPGNALSSKDLQHLSIIRTTADPLVIFPGRGKPVELGPILFLKLPLESAAIDPCAYGIGRGFIAQWPSEGTPRRLRYN
jgi:hypothetical protein